ncbi:MAG: AAA family ATPase [Clostridia bacterium]|nr:AAA family ATPase [Clostridia bacterium]
MKLTKCYIENFGNLSSFKYSFCDGLNVITRENGYGKTTFSMFIKAMLYGLDANKIKGEESERKKYMPWQGGRFGGSLSFTSQGKAYRIERTFGTKASLDKFSLYDEELGTESTDFSENVGLDLFEIDADGFERTVFLSEKNLSPKNQNPTLSAKLSNLVGVDGDVGNFDDAIKALENREKELCHRRGKGGLVWDIRKERDSIDAELLEIKRKEAEYSQLYTEFLATQEKMNALNQKSAVLEKKKADALYAKALLEKKQRVSEEEEKLAKIRNLFGDKIPTNEEIEEYERKTIEKKSKENLISDKKSMLAAIPKADTERFDTLLSALEQSGKDAEKKSALLPFLLAAISLVLGIVLGITATPFLYTVCLLSIVFAILGVLNLKKAPSSQSEHTIDEVCDFLTKITGNFRARTPEEARTELMVAKLNFVTKEKERNNLASSIEELESDVSKFNEYERQVLLYFNIKSAEELPRLRQRLFEYNNFTQALQRMKNELNEYAAEHNLSIEEAVAENTNDLSLDVENERASLRREFYSLDNKLNLISDEISKADELLEKRLELTDAEENALFLHKVTKKAAEHLSLAKDNLTSKYLGKTREAFDKYIEEIAKEDSASFAMDTSFALRKTENGLTTPEDAHSLGKRELYALIMRLALSDSLFPSESPFIILDDPFCHFDDTRCKNALESLKIISKDKQIIYLTCSESRAYNL